MLVAAAGNTALQSVMPAIGREIGIADFWVAIAYTWSAVLWVLLAPYWAEKSDRHGRKALTIIGVGGFIVSMLLCGLALLAGLNGWIAGARDLRPVCPVPRDLRRSRLRDPVGDPGLSGVEDSAQRPGRGAVGAVVVVRPRNDHRPGARADVRASRPGLGRAAVRVRRDRHRGGRRDLALAAQRQRRAPGGPRRGDELSIARHSADRRERHRGDRAAPASAAQVERSRESGRGSCRESSPAMPRPRPSPASAFSSSTGCSSRRSGSEGPIAIVMMAGAAATLGAQWALIPRLDLSPRSLILWGALIAAAGLVGTMLAADLYGITIGFAVASLGFGFARPGFTGGASLAVPLAEQGAVAGVITSANGISYVPRRRSEWASTAGTPTRRSRPSRWSCSGCTTIGREGPRRLGLAAAFGPKHPRKDEADAAHRPHRVALQGILDALIFLEHFGRDRRSGLAQRGLEIGHGHRRRYRARGEARSGQPGGPDPRGRRR